MIIIREYCYPNIIHNGTYCRFVQGFFGFFRRNGSHFLEPVLVFQKPDAFFRRTLYMSTTTQYIHLNQRDSRGFHFVDGVFWNVLEDDTPPSWGNVLEAMLHRYPFVKRVSYLHAIHISHNVSLSKRLLAASTLRRTRGYRFAGESDDRYSNLQGLYLLALHLEDYVPLSTLRQMELILARVLEHPDRDPVLIIPGKDYMKTWLISKENPYPPPPLLDMVFEMGSVIYERKGDPAARAA